MNKEKEEFLRKSLEIPNPYRDKLEKKLDTLRKKVDTKKHYNYASEKNLKYRQRKEVSRITADSILKEEKLKAKSK